MTLSSTLHNSNVAIQLVSMGNTVSTPHSRPPSRKRLAYKPLRSAQAIRVVQVQSADALNGIVCSLRDLDSLHFQPYHCLSYTWGDPFTSNKALVPPTFEIKVDDGHVTITKNLYDALIQLFEDPDFSLINFRRFGLTKYALTKPI